jgi:polysaccharide deacetylase 2 family uncharacterized protein YibQ
MNVVRRRETRDAFTDDEGFEDFNEDDAEAGPSLGHKIALGMSGALFLLLLIGGGTVYYLGRDAGPPPMAMAPITALKVEDEAGQPAAPAPKQDAAKPMAPGAAPTAPAPDAVASTDRSTDRRPWLNNGKGAPAMTPPPAAPAAVAKVEPPPKAEPMKPEPAKVAEAPAAAEPPPAAAVPGAPGAPGRFVPTGNDAARAGDRPRLNDPAIPPADRKALSASPPRFDGIGDLKMKVAAYTKVPAAKTTRSGKIAIVVRGLGMSAAATDAAVSKLPAAVTLSFSPYSPNLKKWLETAKANGHEVLVDVPMESKQYPAEDPGPLGLMTSLEPKKINERIDTMLKTVPGAVGIDDSTGSKFRESESAMGTVFAKLKEKNLVYVQTQPGVLLGQPGVPHTVADVIVDERPFRAAIDARLDYAERLAKFQGSAVAVMSPKPVNFERLALWIETLNAKGIALAPVSEVLVR